MEKFQEFSFCTTDYQDREYEEPHYDEMFSDIKDFIRIALKNGYQLKVWFDGLTVCVEYNYADPSMAGVTLEWVGEDEFIETIKNEVEGEEEYGSCNS